MGGYGLCLEDAFKLIYGMRLKCVCIKFRSVGLTQGFELGLIPNMMYLPRVRLNSIPERRLKTKREYNRKKLKEKGML